MKVRAKELGYYGHKRRQPGQEFELEPMKRLRKQSDGTMKEINISAEQQFSSRWMERVDKPAAPKKEAEPKVETAAPSGL